MLARNIRIPGLIAVLVLAATPALCQQTTYRLRNASAAGDVMTSDSQMNMALKIDTRTGGKAGPSFNTANQERQTYSGTVLAVDKDGNPTEVQRTYSVYRTVDTQPGEDPKTVISALQGKTVTIKRGADGKVVVDVASGSITAEDRKSLEDAFQNGARYLFPEGAISVGDTWSVDSKELAKAFGDAQKASATLKFAEVAPFRGRKCAHLKMNILITMKVPDVNMTMTMKLAGDAYHALDIQRTLAVVLTGPVTAVGSVQDQGKAIALNGTGKCDMRMSYDFQKLAGKPISAQ